MVHSLLQGAPGWEPSTSMTKRKEWEDPYLRNYGLASFNGPRFISLQYIVSCSEHPKSPFKSIQNVENVKTIICEWEKKKEKESFHINFWPLGLLGEIKSDGRQKMGKQFSKFKSALTI